MIRRISSSMPIKLDRNTKRKTPLATNGIQRYLINSVSIQFTFTHTDTHRLKQRQVHEQYRHDVGPVGRVRCSWRERQ